MVDVYRIKTTTPTKTVKDILEKDNLESILDKNIQVILKPNFISKDHYTTGITTDPRVTEGALHYLIEHGFNVCIEEA